MLIKKEGMLRQECKFSGNSDNLRRVFGNSDFFSRGCQNTYNLRQILSRNLEHCQHERRGCLICAAHSSEGSGWVGEAGQGRPGRAGRAYPCDSGSGLASMTVRPARLYVGSEGH